MAATPSSIASSMFTSIITAPLATWSRAMKSMPFTVLLAAPRGFCAGVERAIRRVDGGTHQAQIALVWIAVFRRQARNGVRSAGDVRGEAHARRLPAPLERVVLAA